MHESPPLSTHPYYEIKNWDKHQPPEARNGNARFIRVYTSLLSDPRFFNLSAPCRGILICIWIYQGSTGLRLPREPGSATAALHLLRSRYTEGHLNTLERRGFLIPRVHQRRREESRGDKTPQTPRELGAVDSDGFMKFWDSYPRKIGKAAARKAWGKLKLEPQATRIVIAVNAQRSCPQWRKDQGQFIPHPATWLNQGRWDDEVGTPNTSGITDTEREAEIAIMAKERDQRERFERTQ